MFHPFLTYYEVFLNSFPKVQQSTAYSCGAASLLSILKYFGIEQYTEQDLMKMLYTHASIGTFILNIKQVCNDLNLDFVCKRMSIQELIRYTNEQIPVLILFQGADPNQSLSDEDLSHYAVVVGYDDNQQKVLVYDPWDKKVLKYSSDDFIKKWNGHGYKNYGIAIKGQKPEPRIKKKIKKQPAKKKISD